MKPCRLTALVMLSVLLASCGRKPSEDKKPEPTPTVEPTPVAQPTPAQEINAAVTSEPAPKRRTSPEGVLFVVQSFSVTADDGIHGFPVGKRVQLLREEQGELVVTDGTAEARKPAEFFTNDLDRVENLVRGVRSNAATIEREGRAARETKRQTANELNLQHDRNVLDAQIRRAEEGLAAIANTIRSLEAEIESLRSKYGSYSPVYGWSYRQAWYSSPTRQRDEQQIAQLRNQQRELATQLADLRSKRGKLN